MWKVLGFFAMVPALMAWAGFVVMKLWGWFAVPAGCRPLTVAWAYGLVCLVGVFKSMPRGKADESDGMTTQVVYGLISPLFALGFGYLAHVAMVSWGW
jgi:hypothetical protein